MKFFFELHSPIIFLLTEGLPMKSQLVTFAALIVTNALSFGASLNSLNQDQFKQAFVDKTFTSR